MKCMKIYQQNNINLTVNMLQDQNKHIDPIFTIESLDLDFSKKNKRKNSVQAFPSERKNSTSTHPVEPLRSDRSTLMEKKKNYSQAIRERNLNLISKKRNESLCIQKTNNPDQQQKPLFEIKENFNTDLLKPKGSAKGSKRNEKSSYKRLSSKKSLANFSVLDFDSVPFNIQAIQTQINSEEKMIFCPQVKEMREVAISPINLQKATKKQLMICSLEVNQRIVVLDSDASIILRQNATFKKDLASYRKQNSLLRKQLSDAKSHILQLEERVKSILESTTITKIQESLHETQDNSMNEEIIQKLRTEVAQLRSINSGLELRAYMAEKKVVEEVAACKKKMAKEVFEWRDKCTKLRAQNIKYKNFRDLTISMQISKDQQ